MPFEITSGIQIEPGSYTATLERVEHLTGGKFGDYRAWHWLIDVNGEQKSLESRSSANTGPGSKSFKYLTALLGRTPQAGEKVDDPIGQKAVLQISTNEKGFPRVDEVIPYVEPQQVLPGVPR